VNTNSSNAPEAALAVTAPLRRVPSAVRAKNKPAGHELRRLTDLRAHEQQSIFRDPSSSDIEELALDIEKNGLRQPIEVLPDGTILAGHKRHAALTRLGKAHVEVIVRTDLADDVLAAERFLIEDNLNRRQLSKLSKARCILRLFDLRKHPANKLATAERDRLAELLPCDPRTSNRYLKILKAPRELQDAFEDEAIGFRELDKFFRLHVVSQATAIERIRRGDAPGAAINELTEKDPTAPTAKSLFATLDGFTNRLDQALPHLTPKAKTSLLNRLKSIAASIADS
jgi:ParB/RepB/Spo0J family partition protein